MFEILVGVVALGLLKVAGPPALSQLDVPVATPERIAALSFPAGFARTLRDALGTEASHLPPGAVGRVAGWTPSRA